jgi:hypothetical protein
MEKIDRNKGGERAKKEIEGRRATKGLRLLERIYAGEKGQKD